MSNSNIEKMKRLIEEKRKISAEQSSTDQTPNKKITSYTKGFKNTKRGGALDK